jgi:acetyl-CoA acetyltransferase
MSLRDKTCIVGIGQTAYTKRGRLAGQGTFALACEAVVDAAADAGLPVDAIDGFASFSQDESVGGALAYALGIRGLKYSGMVWGGGGGGGMGALALAVTAVASGMANYVVVLRSICMPDNRRFGQFFVDYAGHSDDFSDSRFLAPYGLLSPAQNVALFARRHVALYGTKGEHFGEVAFAQRFHAGRNPNALQRTPITLEDHQHSRMISDPIRLLDCCMESDGACAVLVTTPERARDLRQPPVRILGAVMGANYRWPPMMANHNLPIEEYGTAGQRAIAERLYAEAGVTPADVDVALLYDHFTPMVLIALEDYGFCGRGEGGPFVEGGGIRWPDGRLPVNTHGGQTSEAYIHMNHLIEGVRQLRGTSSCQVADAEIALVTGAPGPAPTTAALLRR